MSTGELTAEDIQEILRIFAESELEELRLEVGGTRLHVSKGGNGLGPVPPLSADRPTGAAPPSGGGSTSGGAPTTEARQQPDAGSVAPTPPTAPGGDVAETVSPVEAPPREGIHELRSPVLGVFYRRPSPDQPPFVEVGSEVGADDPVCIVDVMKMFTRVPAGVAGRIAEILVEDGQLVEHGQVLMRIEER